MKNDLDAEAEIETPSSFIAFCSHYSLYRWSFLLFELPNRNSNANPSSSKATISARPMQDERRSKMNTRTVRHIGAFAGRFFPQIQPSRDFIIRNQSGFYLQNSLITRPLLGTHDNHINYLTTQQNTWRRSYRRAAQDTPKCKSKQLRGYFSNKTDNTTRGGEAEWDELRFIREFAGRRFFPQNSTLPRCIILKSSWFILLKTHDDRIAYTT